MSSKRPRPTGSVPTSGPSARRPRHRFGRAQLWRRWARGVLERIRLQGGIAHPWLDKFISSGGNRQASGEVGPAARACPLSRLAGPPPASRLRPGHPKRSTPFQGRRAGMPCGQPGRWGCPALMRPDMSERSWTPSPPKACCSRFKQTTSPIYGAPASHIHVRRTTDPNPAALRCGVCSTVFPAPSEVVGRLDGAPCMRVTCPGNFSPTTTLESDYY